MFFSKRKREIEELKRENRKLKDAYLLAKDQIHELKKSNDTFTSIIKSQENDIQSLMETGLELHLKAKEAETKKCKCEKKGEKVSDGKATRTRKPTTKKNTTTK